MARAAKVLKKHCPVCDRDLPLEAFGNDRTSKDKRYRICKECDRTQQRAWREARKSKLDAEAAQAEAAKAARRQRRQARPKA
jgi:hypothetical protein